jgi:hypothetical protein
MPKAKATTGKALRPGSQHETGSSSFYAATGTDHAAIGITRRAMQAMAIRELIQRDAAGAFGLTDAGRAVFAAVLERAGIR